MDTYKILLDNVEVARITGESLECAVRDGREDLKCIKKNVNGQTLFVLMASTQRNVTVEKVLDPLDAR